MRTLTLQFFLLVVVGTFLCASADAAYGTEDKPKRALRLEVEIERGKELDRLTVYVCNDTTDVFTFYTGGSGGSLDDQKKDVDGSGRTVVPELDFQLDDGRYVTLKPPAFSGPGTRYLTIHKAQIRPGQRVAYANCLVPHVYVAGKFGRAVLRLKDGREIVGDKLIEKKPAGKRKP